MGAKIFAGIVFSFPILFGFISMDKEPYGAVMGIFFILFGMIGLFLCFVYPHIKEVKRIEKKIESIDSKKKVIEQLSALENNLKQVENSIHEDIKESIDGILVHVSMLSGIPVKKINKEKAIDSIYKYLLQTNHTDELTLTKDTMNIVWSIAKENNQFKEIKLQDSAPNSKIRIKLIEILNNSAEFLRSKNLHVSKNSIREASNLIAMYIDKYVFSEPTIEQEEDMTIPILFYCLAEKENEDNIINNFGINFYDQLMRSSMTFLMVYRKSLITDLASPSSPEFINASNNFNYYLDILLKENKK